MKSNPIVALLQHAITLTAGVVLTIFALPLIAPNFVDTTDTSSSVPVIVPTAIPDTVVPVTLSEQEDILGDLYDRVAPSVVAISLGVRLEGTGAFTSVSSGSGFAISEQGYIVTNAHVVRVPPDVEELIDDASSEIEEVRVEVSMFDGTIAEAEIVGSDADSDIAVLQVDVPANTLPIVEFGDSSNLRVGQSVVAIGNPFSNDWTMTTGIVSALNRSIVGLQGFSIGGVIQTDAAINPGNSGGPLVNLDGQVIGVNSQINSENGANTGIGFAVPSNLVQVIAQSLIDNGEVAYSFIGIQSLPVNLDLVTFFDLPANLRGVGVRIAFSDMPAGEAGLASVTNDSVDVITAIDGTAIADFDELIGYLAINTVPGDTVTLTIYRSGESNFVDIPVTLTERPDATVSEDDSNDEDDEESDEDR